jgi:glycosyltransferase involved in cell wall biosynthesis
VFLSESDRLGSMGVDRCGEVIRHGVEESLFRVVKDGSIARRELGLEQDVKCILYLGGFSRIKGIFVLLEALEVLLGLGMRFVCLMPGTVRDRGTGWRSHLGRAAYRLAVGGTDEEKALAAIRERRLGTVVRQMEFTNDLCLLFEAADVLVFPSTVPHFSNPVIEAGAAGIPVVASDFPAMRESVDDGKTGVLVRPGDARALASALQALLCSPECGWAMGRAARERARSASTHPSEGARWVEVYNRVTRGHERRG